MRGILPLETWNALLAYTNRTLFSLIGYLCSSPSFEVRVENSGQPEVSPQIQRFRGTKLPLSTRKGKLSPLVETRNTLRATPTTHFPTLLSTASAGLHFTVASACSIEGPLSRIHVLTWYWGQQCLSLVANSAELMYGDIKMYGDHFDMERAEF